MSDLAIIEIAPDLAPSIYVPNGLDAYLEQIRQLSQEVPDVTTKKGRDRIGSLARAVGSSKKAIENPGRAYLKLLKEAVKPAEEELKRFVDACDDISKAILKPRVEWEAEQDRIAAEKAAEEERLRIEAEEKAAQEALKKDIEVKHEMALLLNEKFDRDLAEAKAEAERQRIAHEEELTRQAAEKSKREAEEKIERERTESARREAELKLKAEQAERDRIASEQKAAAEKVAAAEQAEREKQEAIAAEQRKAQEEANRIKREAEEAEAARVAEQNRIAAEDAARTADVEHRRVINASAVQALIDQGIPEDWAKACVIAIARGKVPSTSIKY